MSPNLFKLGPVGEPKVLCPYLILDDSISVVDCGPSVVIEEVLQLAKECGVSADEIDNLLLTHIHIDHAGGTAEFIKKCPKARVFVPERGFRHLIDPSALNSSARAVLGDELFDYWGEAKPVEESKVRSMAQGEVQDLGSEKVRYLEARGHAPHHDVLLLEESKILFAADSLGIHDDKIAEFHSPTTPPPSFNFDQQLKDFEMIQKLESKLLCFSHFRSLVPTKEFYMQTVELYREWERIIGGYLAETHVMGKDITRSDIEEIYSRLRSKYSAYRNVTERFEHQMKKVDITGFAQWFDFKMRRS